MKHAAIIFFILCHSLVSQCQSFSFAQAYSQNVLGGYTIADNNNNLLLLGSFNGTVDLNFGSGVNNVTAIGQYNMCVIKEDPNGNFIWEKTFFGLSPNVYYNGASRIAVDADNNIYIAGDFVDSFDFDPGPGIFPMSSHGGTHAFIEKLDSNGNFIWAKHFGGVGLNTLAVVSDFKLNKNKNSIYLLCPIQGTIDADPGPNTYSIFTSNTLGNDILIEKLDTAGNFIWAKQIKGTNDHDAFTLDIDSSNSIFFAGKFKDSIDFDPGISYVPAMSNGGYDVFVEKLDSNGNYVWAKQIGEANYDEEAHGVAVDRWDNVLLTGYFKGTMDFDPGPAIHNLSASSQDFFLLKLNHNGNYAWSECVNTAYNDDGRSLITDTLGHVYAIGELASSGDYDPGVGVYNLTSNGINTFIQTLDSSGNFIWAETFGSSGWDLPSHIVSDKFYNLLISGNIGVGGQGGSGDFDPGPGVFILGGTNIGFLEKLCNSSPISLAASTVVFCEGDTALLYTPPLSNTAFQWVKDGTILPNVSGDTLRVTQTGNYSVSISGNSCAQSTAIFMQALPVVHPTISITANPTVPFGQQATVTANITGISGSYTIHWFVNGQIFTTTTNVFTYTKAWGTDTITASIIAPCSDTSLSTVIYITSIDAIQAINPQPSFFLTPNPATNTLYLQSTQAGSLEITDLTGRILLQSQITNHQSQIDINSLDVGVYVYRFLTNDGAATQGKLVIMH
jgi:hypothetical protein